MMSLTESRPSTIARGHSARTGGRALLACSIRWVSLLSESLGIVFTTHDSLPAAIRSKTMNGSRCHGLRVREHFLDFDGTIGHRWAKG